MTTNDRAEEGPFFLREIAVPDPSTGKTVYYRPVAYGWITDRNRQRCLEYWAHRRALRAKGAFRRSTP